MLRLTCSVWNGRSLAPPRAIFERLGGLEQSRYFRVGVLVVRRAIVLDGRVHPTLVVVLRTSDGRVEYTHAVQAPLRARRQDVPLAAQGVHGAGRQLVGDPSPDEALEVLGRAVLHDLDSAVPLRDVDALCVVLVPLKARLVLVHDRVVERQAEAVATCQVPPALPLGTAAALVIARGLHVCQVAHDQGALAAQLRRRLGGPRWARRGHQLPIGQVGV
mmetsp:Transcript_23318/g.72627  ORF Transcript_23318/g.72627 Transcript_23318/m.72627 type:complete len:218 (-) Transcript_23318:241-894(-)